MIFPWFFALNHTNYARWTPIHLRDMVSLAEKHPAVHQEFMSGKFTVNKTGRNFSNIAVDQAHEQSNACVKGDGRPHTECSSTSKMDGCWTRDSSHDI